MSVTGEPGRGPMRVGVAVADLAAGFRRPTGVVALVEREHSGQGQWVHTSLLQAMTPLIDFQAVRYLMDGEVPAQDGQLPPDQHAYVRLHHSRRLHQRRRFRRRNVVAPVQGN